jgi:hypothetical protein
MLNLVYKTKITLKEGYLRILPFIKYNIIKNRNILNKNKCINNIKYLSLPLIILHLTFLLYYFNLSYFYTKLKTRVIIINLIITFAFLIFINVYLYNKEVNKTLVLKFKVIKGFNPNIL